MNTMADWPMCRWRATSSWNPTARWTISGRRWKASPSRPTQRSLLPPSALPCRRMPCWRDPDIQVKVRHHLGGKEGQCFTRVVEVMPTPFN